MTGREVIGSCVPEMLIADADFAMSVVTVTISATPNGERNLERGSVLAADDATGKCCLLNGAEGTTAAYILAEPVATCQGRIHHFLSLFLGLPCFPCSKSWRMTRFSLSSTLWVLLSEKCTSTK